MSTPPILVAMAGLPGTGKSTLARKLAAHLNGTVIDKDEVRHALFPAPWTEYSAGQDDFVLDVMLAAAERLIATQHCPAVFIDGPHVFAKLSTGPGPRKSRRARLPHVRHRMRL